MGATGPGCRGGPAGAGSGQRPPSCGDRRPISVGAISFVVATAGMALVQLFVVAMRRARLDAGRDRACRGGGRVQSHRGGGPRLAASHSGWPRCERARVLRDALIPRRLHGARQAQGDGVGSTFQALGDMRRKRPGPTRNEQVRISKRLVGSLFPVSPGSWVRKLRSRFAKRLS